MRAKVLKLHPQTIIKLKRLKKESEIDGAYRVAKRLHAILLNHDGNTSSQISNLLDAPRSCVTEWLTNYERYSVDGLLEGYRSGRPAGLTDKQKKELSDIVESGPVAYGFLSGVWTAVMIGCVIQNEFSIEYDQRHVRRILGSVQIRVAAFG